MRILLIKYIMKYDEVYIFNDQPTTCPKCGNRTEIIFDFPHSVEKTRYHKCLTINCKFNFIVEENIQI